MVATDYCFIGSYHIKTALSLLGPANFGPAKPHGCMDHLAMVLNQIVIIIFRLFNLFCGDRHWYDNETARRMLELYLTHPQQPLFLNDQVRQLYDALLLRANGHASYAEGIHIPLPPNQAPRHLTELSLIETQSGDPAASAKYLGASLTTLPLEVLIKEILPKCDGESLVHLESTCKDLRMCIQGEPSLYRDLMIDLALKKALKCQASPTTNISILCEFAKIQAAIHPKQAEALIREALEGYQNLAEDQFLFWEKLETLSKIALAQASIHPELAIATAEQIAAEWGDADKVYGSMAKVFAAANIEQAIALTNRIDKSQKSGILKDLFIMLSFSNPEQAIAYTINTFPDLHERDDVLEAIGRNLVPTDLRRAMDIAEMISDILPQNGLRQAIAVALHPSYPEEAAKIVDRLPHPYFRDRFFYHAAIQEAASTSARQALATAHRIADPATKDLALESIVAEIAPADIQTAIEITDCIQNESCKENALVEIARAQTSHNVKQALATASTIRCENAKDRALSSIAEAEAPIDFAQAVQILNLIQDPDYKEEASCKIAQRLALTHFHEALEYFVCTAPPLLSDEEIRCRISILCNILNNHISTRPDQHLTTFFHALSYASKMQDNYFRCCAIVQIARMLAGLPEQDEDVLL